ncbi:3-deoxy-manno-octulosonate cytidylyltransferase [Sphingomonas sp. ID0503]|uniref:3-deoxy-manno-octulosonate cytidylyltransferase n=1 Tax=Sphingomonas sp. ID0503 TaxID=3399691 RepID=UPI003AFB24C3
MNLVVIPARYGSSRFPGKPLAQVRGTSMLQRVWALVRAGAPEARILVATDDARIAAHAVAFGAEAIMTSDSVANGTERAAAVLAALDDEALSFIVNLQGDAVLTPPWVISAMIEAGRSGIDMVTPATVMSAPAAEALRAAKARGEVGGTTVVFDREGRALYFSKSIIPFVRPGGAPVALHRHIGLYGYRPDVLRRLVSLPPGPLEQAEQLEQLRALENGIPIQVVTVDYRGRTHWGVDTPEDLARCEALIDAEGELLTAYDGSGRVAA